MSASELAPGTVMGARYRLERLLGEGGMGAVWAAEDLESGGRCAVKVMKEDAADGEARRRFLREGRAAASVRHPHVVEIREVIEVEGGAPVLVMELLEGEPLRARLAREGKLSLGALAELLVPVVSAVGAAHALGIVHRDLKPENIFVASGGVKVLDFGIAKLTALDGEAVRSTGITTGAVLGTPAYMAPEQVFAERDLDHRADIWALGIVLYEGLSGECPTAGENVGQVLKHVVARPFTPLGALVPELPADVAALVARMLERERADRPADLREVAGVLERYAGSAGLPFGAPAVAAAAPARPGESTIGPIAAASITPRVVRDADVRDADSVATQDGRPPDGGGARRGRALEATETAGGGAARRGRATETAGGGAARRGRATETAGGGAAGPATTGRGGAPLYNEVTQRGIESRRRLRRYVLGAAGIAGVALLGAGVWRLSSSPAEDSPPTPGSAPPIAVLEAPESKLACPVLRASGVDAPAGWLGAAAAAVACERARLLLGGRPERTLAPAELLDLPRGPVDAFPADPYGAPDARERTLTAARARGAAYLDGEVSWSAAGFEVTLALHAAGGAELRRASGRGRGLYEAVRAAMAPLAGPGGIPPSRALDPEIAAWARTASVNDALASIDLTFALAHNAGGLPAECERFTAASERIPELGPEGRWLCAYTLGRPPPALELGPPDGSDAAIATRIRLYHLIRKSNAAGDADLVRDLLDRERTPRGRGILAGTESCLRGATDPRAARERAILAVQSEPKSPEGGWCNPWEQLMSIERDTGGSDGTVRAMQAWLPWNSYAWLEPGFRSRGADPAVLPLLRRAHQLSPLDTQIAGTLAGALLAAGDRAAARGVAAQLRTGGLPLHAVESDLILVRVEASEGRFGAALERARTAAELAPGDAGWVRAQRFEIGWHALELAALLGRAREVADVLVARFVDPEPPPLAENDAAVPMRLPALCALSSSPARCFARFHALRPRLVAALTPDSDAFAAGAERYVQRDHAGAARAWRPLLGGPLLLASTLPDAMADAFERTGASDLAAQVDAEVMKRAAAFGGATPAHVRAARRALARGDRTEARRLAALVVKAWGRADEEPPGLAEMRRLLAR